MKFGFALPQVGSSCGRESTLRFARGAESAGYDSVWVLDRLLFPTASRERYPASADGQLPEAFQRVLDPLGLLAFAAACTENVGLGTSILNVAWYNPVVLARMLASIDVLSGGRLTLGIGTGWCPEEYTAAGSSWRDRGKLTTEVLDILKAVWSSNELELTTEHFAIPPAQINLKPLQRPHPPIYMAAYGEPAMRRILSHGDGWMPAGIPLPVMAGMFEELRRRANAMGRDPQSLQMVVRANIHLLGTSPGSGRPPFVGTLNEIREDIQSARRAGATELLFDAQFSPGCDSLDALEEQMRTLLTLGQD